MFNCRSAPACSRFTQLLMCSSFSYDMLHSAIFDSPLVFTVPESGPASVQYSYSNARDAEVLARLIPILRVEQQECASSGDSAHVQKLHGLTELHSDAADCIKSIMVDDGFLNFRTKDNATLESFRCALEAYRQTNCRAETNVSSPQFLARACYLDMSMCYNLVLGMPHRHAGNQPSVHGLSDAMRAIDDETWTHMPYLRLHLSVLETFGYGSDAANNNTQTSEGRCGSY